MTCACVCLLCVLDVAVVLGLSSSAVPGVCASVSVSSSSVFSSFKSPLPAAALPVFFRLEFCRRALNPSSSRSLISAESHLCIFSNKAQSSLFTLKHKHYDSSTGKWASDSALLCVCCHSQSLWVINLFLISQIKSCTPGWSVSRDSLMITSIWCQHRSFQELVWKETLSFWNDPRLLVVTPLAGDRERGSCIFWLVLSVCFSSNRLSERYAHAQGEVQH